MFRQLILGIIASICLASAVAAQTLTFPSLTGRIVDQANILSPEDQAALTQSLAELESKTTDQLVVVTLKSLDGTSIDDYGYQLGRYWQIGKKGQDNGVLLIVVPSLKAVRIEVGYGLEGTLTDAASHLIIDQSILPQFKAGNFSGGIDDGVTTIIKFLENGQTGPPPAAAAPVAETDTSDNAGSPGWPVIFLVLGGTGLLILCSVTGGGRLCRTLFQLIFLLLLAGRGGGSSRGRSPWSGGGGSFGGGGSSGSW